MTLLLALKAAAEIITVGTAILSTIGLIRKTKKVRKLQAIADVLIEGVETAEDMRKFDPCISTKRIIRHKAEMRKLEADLRPMVKGITMAKHFADIK